MIINFSVIMMFTVQVELADGEMVEAITYIMIKPLLEDRRPSALYHAVIMEGAREHSLPAEYLRKLENIQHNGETVGDGSIRVRLGKF